jgi:putative ABC transport system substrate-binding protein
MRARRRSLGVLAALLAAPAAAWAQKSPARMQRVGFLISETLEGQSSRVRVMRESLKDLGFVEGRDIAIDIRTADGAYDRLPALAADLVKVPVDVLVTFGSKAAQAAASVTSRVPIVVPVIGDPIGLGLAPSLAAPGRNVTGTSTFGPELVSKRMELLKEALPRMARVAWLNNPANPSRRAFSAALERTARALKVEMHPWDIGVPARLERLFGEWAKSVDGVLVSTDTFFQSHAAGIAALATKYRLASVGGRAYAEAGGMLGYGFDDDALYRRGAHFVSRILRGARSAELPIEQASSFDLVVNQNAARAVGVEISTALLTRAARVIE